MVSFRFSYRKYSLFIYRTVYDTSKSSFFNNIDIAKGILDTSDIGKIKALGHSVKNYEDIIWNGMRHIVVYQGLFEKFRQNNELKQKLLDTGNNILAEWQGQNLLGFSLIYVLMMLR